MLVEGGASRVQGRLLHLALDSRRSILDVSTGGCRIRTCEGISHQIYSLTRLTASVTPRDVWLYLTGTGGSFLPADVEQDLTGSAVGLTASLGSLD